MRNAANTVQIKETNLRTICSTTISTMSMTSAAGPSDHAKGPSHQDATSEIPVSLGTDGSIPQQQCQADVPRESQQGSEPHQEQPGKESSSDLGHHAQDGEHTAPDLYRSENDSQEDSTSPNRQDNDTDEDDLMSDARSDASSESDMFVNDGIKSEHGSDTGSPGITQDQPEEPGDDTQRQDRNHDHDELVEDDDDECMVISAEDVSDDIMAKFTNFKFGGTPEKATDEVVCTGSARVKREQDDDGLVVISDADNEDDPDFRMDEDGSLSDGERPRKRRRQPPKRQARRNETSVPKAPEHTNVTGDSGQGGDGSWQEPTDDELLQLYTQQQKLNAIKSQRTLTLPERVMLAKVSAKVTEVEQMASLQASDLGDPMDLFGDGQDEDQAAEATPAPTEEVAPNQEQSTGTENKKPRGPPKTAKEFWEREYEEKGSGVRNMTDNLTNKRKRPLKKGNSRKKSNKSNTRESRLMNMLRDANPIMARAAQGAMEMPGAIQATRRSDQLKAMKDFLFKISSNPNPRSSPLDMKILNYAVKSFGFRQVRTVNDRWKLRGMVSTLYNHQLVGVSRMLCQEFSPDGPYGGILGDQMGLGKTVQMLATMSANRPTPEEVRDGRHQTLIIAPAVVIDQWMREIVRHCDRSFIKSVHHYRASAKVTPEVWQTADVV